MSQQVTVMVGHILKKYLKIHSRNKYIEKKRNYHSKQILYYRNDNCSSGCRTNPFQEYYSPSKQLLMLRWALIFFIVAIVAAIFGFGGIAAGAASIAKILFFIFLVLFVISLIMGAVRK
jgi:uncharacterized membrane protein YtjA (UPF0391 family)